MPTLKCPSEGQLLKAFVDEQDEEAFAELVHRLGPLVLKVCRRVLGNETDAEDAAQAAFLALAQQARRSTGIRMPGAWLHRVAHDIAVNLLRARKTRQRHEKEVTAMSPQTRELTAVQDSQTALLHAAINALPKKHRQAVVLYHLEGKSLEQAAAIMACPESTVSTWVARGRERIRSRLARRGLVLSLAALTSLLSAEAGAAELPATFVAATTKAASLFVAGKTGAGVGAAALSPHIAALAEGALRNMLYAKMSIAILVLVLISGIGGGAGWFASRAMGAEGNGAQPKPTVTPSPKATARLQDLQEMDPSRLNALRQVYGLIGLKREGQNYYVRGFCEVFTSSEELMKALKQQDADFARFTGQPPHPKTMERIESFVKAVAAEGAFDKSALLLVHARLGGPPFDELMVQPDREAKKVEVSYRRARAGLRGAMARMIYKAYRIPCDWTVHYEGQRETPDKLIRGW